MAENTNQVAILFINGTTDSETIGFVTNYGMTFNQGAGTVLASITLHIAYQDSNPVFDFFVQNQPAEIKLEVTNTLDFGGPTTRTLVFQNAICRNYTESFSMTSQTTENINDLMASITIEAQTATIGETNFPA